MATEMNLYQKLAKIRSICDVMVKNKSGYGYKYTSIDEILAKVTGGMKKYGVSLIPMVHDSATTNDIHYEKTKVLKNGDVIKENINEFIVNGPMVFRWVNDESPTEFIDVKWYMTGCQQDPSQAFGSAMTYALRYFLLQYFQIAALDEQDPDSWRSKQSEAENNENMLLAKQIIDEVHNLVSSYLEKNPDKRDEVVKIVKGFAKEKNKPSANYFAITDPAIASALLSKLNEKIGG